MTESKSPAPFSAREATKVPPAPAISVRLTDAERALVDAAAARVGLTRSEYVRRAIGQAVSDAIRTGGAGV